jgi:MIP family channel proteins
MKDSYRHFVAELIGTFALVFVGSGAIMRSAGSGIATLEVALAHGLVLACMVSAFMRISGHFNPAVTLAFLATGRISTVMAGIYVLAQFLGATLAAYLLASVFPAEVVEATRLGGQYLAGTVSFAEGVVLEAVATFFLVIVIFGTAVDPRATKVGGLAIGFIVAADILVIGGLTGASMNPARSFGPAVVSQLFEGHAVYWIGPIAGALLAGALYEYLFIRREPEPHDHGAIRPA